MTEKLTTFTFKGSGVQIALKPVNPLLVKDLMMAIDEPTPPMIEVDNPDGSKRQEPNDLDPGYRAARSKYTEATTEAMLEAYIDFGVVYRFREEDHAKITKIRDLFKRKSGKDHPDPDMRIFIRLVAIQAPEDLGDFINAASGRSMPTDPKSVSGSESGASHTTGATSSNTPLPEAESPSQ